MKKTKEEQRRARAIPGSSILRQRVISAFLASLLVCSWSKADASAQSRSASLSQLPVAPTADLAKTAKLPYQSFTLANGLTTIVVSQPQSPLVRMALYYRVGSRDEPIGRTGFAHLFEHMMFQGSEHVPNFGQPLEASGALFNGSTWFDYTGYVIDAPRGALGLSLFQESDRMGYLLGALNQKKLKVQRDVVLNEKRQYDNQPHGLTSYALLEELFPAGHPYRHDTIGFMTDLQAASLEDVHAWFRAYYGPNNAVLVLWGNIDLPTARATVEQWFGSIPRGPVVKPAVAGPVDLPAPRRREIHDNVALLRLQRVWSGPPLQDPDSAALEVGLRALGGMKSSRMERTLMRAEGLADGVLADMERHQLASVINVQMDVRHGINRDHAEAALDAELSRFLREGPAPSEVQRAVTSLIAERLYSLDESRHTLMAEGWVQADDPSFWIEHDLRRIAAVTPEMAKAVLRRWLKRPGLTLTTIPGERKADGDPVPAEKRSSDSIAKSETQARGKSSSPSTKRTSPAVLPAGPLAFTQVQRTVLSNGIPVALVRRSVSPTVQISLSFAGGYAADTIETPGMMHLMLRSMPEGTIERDAEALIAANDQLGASITTTISRDFSWVQLSALSPNLGPSLALLADVVRHPAFRSDAVQRLKQQQQADLLKALRDPTALAYRKSRAMVFGPAHPYGVPDSLGTVATIEKITTEALLQAHSRWFRPDLTRITVVGDVEMEQLQPLLEQSFGRWPVPHSTPPTVLLPDVPAQPTRLLLVDRPGAGQSVIVAARALPLRGTDRGLEKLELANEVLGGGFLSRIFTTLREKKGWSYGAYSSLSANIGPLALAITAPVQSDRTADAIRTIMAEMGAFATDSGVQPEELQRVTEGNVRKLAALYRNNGEILNQVLQNDQLQRPADYLGQRAAILRAIDAEAINQAARRHLHPEGLQFVVVGDRAAVEPQLRGLDLPIEIVPADMEAAITSEAPVAAFAVPR
jgi:zinc protease